MAGWLRSGFPISLVKASIPGTSEPSPGVDKMEKKKIRKKNEKEGKYARKSK